MVTTSFKRILEWVKQEKKYFYQLGYIFCSDELWIEEALLQTIKSKQNLEILDESFKQQFIQDFYVKCSDKKCCKHRAELIDGIEKKLFQLNQPIRQCLYLKYVRQMSSEEIASLMDMSSVFVRSHTIEAFQQLMEEEDTYQCYIPIEKLLSYHEGEVSLVQYKQLNRSISENDSCSKRLETVIKLVDELQQLFFTIEPSIHFLEMEKPLTEKENKKTVMKQRFMTVFVATFLLIVFVVSSIGIPELSKQWKSWTGQAVGYGEEVFVQAIDNNVEITITHVAADERQTILFYEIRDLDENYQFLWEFYNSLFDIVETDIWDTPFFNFYSAPLSIGNVLAEDGVSKGRIFLPPLKNEQETITVRFRGVERLEQLLKDEISYDDLFNPESRILIEGEWLLEVPITKYEGDYHELDETLTVNDFTIQLKGIEINPTSTVIIYSFNGIKETIHEHHEIRFSHLVANKQEYLTDFYVSDWGGRGQKMQDGDHSFAFESVYYAKPKKLKLFLDRMISNYYYEQTLTIDYANLPFEFTVAENKVLIEEKLDGQSRWLLFVEESVENRSYDHFSMGSTIIGSDGTVYHSGLYTEGVWVDREGTIYVDPDELIRSSNPYTVQYMSTERRFEMYEAQRIWLEGFQLELTIFGHNKSEMVNQQIDITIK